MLFLCTFPMKQLRNIAFILVAFAATALQAQSLKEAQRLTRNEQFEDAEKVYNSLIVAKAKVVDNYYYAGLNAIMKGDSLQAIAFFDKGLLANPKKAWLCYVGKGNMALRQGKDSEAELLFAQARQTSKKMLGVVNKEIGRAYLMVEFAPKSKLLANAQKALTYLNESNDDFEAKLMKGDALWTANPGDASLAVQQFILSGYEAVEDPRPLLREALVYQRVRNYDLSKLRVEEAIAKDADYAPAYRQLADLMGLMGNRDSAVYYYQQYLKRNNNTSARVKYVQALYFNKQFLDCVQEAETLLGEKSIPSLYGVIAFAVAELENPSAEDIQKGLNNMDLYETKFVKQYNRMLSPNETLVKGLLMHKNGQIDAGFVLIKQCLSDTARASEMWYDRVQNMYYGQDEWEYASEIFKLKQVKLGTLNERDMYFWGRSLSKIGRNEEALSIYRGLIEADSNYVSGYKLIADTYYEMDKSDSLGRATATYKTWISKLSAEQKESFRNEIGYTYVKMAMAAQTRKNYELASEYFGMAIEIRPEDTQAATAKAAIDSYLEKVREREARRAARENR
jgi:tetratricopeptide (TPR) repeat protein